MAKMRVHELAKEIDKQSKEIINLLTEKGVEVKNHMTTLEEGQVTMVKELFAGKASKPVKEKAETPKPVKEIVEAPNPLKEQTAAPKQDAAEKNVEVKAVDKTEVSEQKPAKKKPNIIFVNNPHNSRVPGGNQPNRQGGRVGDGRPNPNAASQPSSEHNTTPADNNVGTGATVPSNANASGIRPSTGNAGSPATQERRPDAAGRPASANTTQQSGDRRENTGRPYNNDRGNNYSNNSGARTGSYNNNNSGARTGSYNNNNSGARTGSYNNNNSGARTGSYNNNNSGAGTGSYNNNNSGARTGGYNNNNSGAGTGSYNNNNSGARTGSYNNNNSGARTGSYNNNNSGAGTGSYNNNNSGSRTGSYNNNNSGARTGSYNNNNSGAGGNSYNRNNTGSNNRPAGTTGYRPNNGTGGGYSGGQQRPQTGTDQNRDFRRSPGTRPGFGGPDNRFPRTGRPANAVPEAPAKDQERHRDDQEKRRQNQEKRKKDVPTTNDDGALKSGKAKSRNGKFTRIERPTEKLPIVKEEVIKVVVLPEVLTIKELAEKMKMQPSVIVKKLFLQGKVVTVNQEISFEQAGEIAIEFEVICEREPVIDVIGDLLREEEENTEDMIARPPVICVMGHVDHGKTSLLDAIRKSNVTDREAGGITQHIGAYVVNINNQKITFLDTPGHEAFTAMRMRGANSTDIAILVVAADDGVMPQTVEAINHAKAANIEIIVAVNKMDKPSANIDRVKQELAEYELTPEDWGGTTVYAPVSAKSGEGVEQLLEMILLTSEILELKADPKRQARGLVIEAELDKGRGPVATVLVQKGTLRVGDFIAAGSCNGKVRAMIDDKGKRVKEAGPSTPVEILGLNDVPNAGEIFVAPENDREAKNFAATFISHNRVRLLEDTKARMSLDDLFVQIKAGNLKELNLIIKADVQGSVEAVKQSLLKLSNEEVVVKVIHGGVGAINESDVSLASASNAIIIGFNVRPDVTAKSIAEAEGVDVRIYKVIYQAIEDVEAAMKGMLDPVFEEKVLGHAEIRQIFKASGIGTIAGSYVLDGIFQRGCSIRITREGEQIYEGPLSSLKRFKDDVKEVKTGFECGLVFESFNDLKELDIVEAYTMVEVPR